MLRNIISCIQMYTGRLALQMLALAKFARPQRPGPSAPAPGPSAPAPGPYLLIFNVL